MLRCPCAALPRFLQSEAETSGAGMKVWIQRDLDALDLPLPEYATAGAAGMDLRAAVDTVLRLMPGERARVSTGIRLRLPEGYEGQVRPRSGLAWRQGVTLLNAPGTIDCDYTGTVYVILINLSQEPVSVQRGERVAQLVVAPIVRICWQEAEVLPSDADSADPSSAAGRGENGFGSTGRW